MSPAAIILKAVTCFHSLSAVLTSFHLKHTTDTSTHSRIEPRQAASGIVSKRKAGYYTASQCYNPS